MNQTFLYTDGCENMASLKKSKTERMVKIKKTKISKNPNALTFE